MLVDHNAALRAPGTHGDHHEHHFSQSNVIHVVAPDPHTAAAMVGLHVNQYSRTRSEAEWRADPRRQRNGNSDGRVRGEMAKVQRVLKLGSRPREGETDRHTAHCLL